MLDRLHGDAPSWSEANLKLLELLTQIEDNITLIEDISFREELLARKREIIELLKRADMSMLSTKRFTALVNELGELWSTYRKGNMSDVLYKQALIRKLDSVKVHLRL